MPERLLELIAGERPPSF